jgi:hypothetical protein
MNDIFGDITSEASWWGSRAWARWSLRKLPDEERRARLNMISAAAQMLRDLKYIEDSVRSKDVDGIVNAVNAATILGVGYLSSFAEDYKKLLSAHREYKLPPVDVGETAEKQIVPEQQQRPISPWGATPPEPHKADEKPQEAPKSAQKGISDKILDKILYINNSLPKISSVNRYILESEEFKHIDNATKSELNSIYLNIRNLVINFDIAYRTAGADVTSDIGKWAKSIVSFYNKFIVIASSIISPSMKIDNLELLAATVPGKFSNKSYNIDGLKKIAQKTLSKWTNRKLLSLSEDTVRTLKKNIILETKKVIFNIDDILNILEDREVSFSKINAEMVKLTDSIINMLNSVSVSARIYYLKQDYFVAKKGRKVTKIKKSIFSDINKIISELRSIIEMALEK